MVRIALIYNQTTKLSSFLKKYTYNTLDDNQHAFFVFFLFEYEELLKVTYLKYFRIEKQQQLTLAFNYI